MVHYILFFLLAEVGQRLIMCELLGNLFESYINQKLSLKEILRYHIRTMSFIFLMQSAQYMISRLQSSEDLDDSLTDIPRAEEKPVLINQKMSLIQVTLTSVLLKVLSNMNHLSLPLKIKSPLKLMLR